MGNVDWQVVLEFFGPFTALIAASVALLVNAAVVRRNKAIDIIVKCSEKFDENRDKRELMSYNKNNAKKNDEKYFRKYWALQSDQFDFWLSGFVDPETMASWAFSCCIRFNEPGYQSGWNSYKREYAAPNPIFIGFIDRINRVVNDYGFSKISEREIPMALQNIYLAVIDELIVVEKSESIFIRRIRGRLTWFFTSPLKMKFYKKIYINKRRIT